jgi:hypothetical protein
MPFTANTRYTRHNGDAKAKLNLWVPSSAHPRVSRTTRPATQPASGGRGRTSLEIVEVTVILPAHLWAGTVMSDSFNKTMSGRQCLHAIVSFERDGASWKEDPSLLTFSGVPVRSLPGTPSARTGPRVHNQGRPHHRRCMPPLLPPRQCRTRVVPAWRPAAHRTRSNSW